MPAFLVPVDSGQCLIPLEKAIVLIGRQSDCDVSLTHSRKISRKHCCVAQVNNRFVIRDLGSTNGIFLNGIRVHKEAQISVGDELVIGDVRFRMQNEAPAVSKSKPAQNGGQPPIPAEAAAEVPPIPPPIPVRRRPSVSVPPNSNIPVALADDSRAYSVESSNKKRGSGQRKRKGDELADEVESADDDAM
jgi:pSer/pThr/pTyr-binding forkhead associated (FHA) protein